MPQQDLTKLFTQLAGRKPTGSDLGYLTADIEYPELRPGETTADNFNNRLKELSETHSLDPQALRDLVARRADQAAREREVETTRRAQRDKTIKSVLFWVFTATLLGCFSGGGWAYYQTRYDSIVQFKVQELEAQKADLQRAYYGKLDTLLQATAAPQLSPLESQLYTQVALRVPTGSETTIFNRETETVTITVTKTDYITGDRGYNESQVVLVRRDPKGVILSAHSYETGDPLDRSKPLRSIFFQADALYMVDHKYHSYQKIQGNKVVYNKKDDDENIYDKQATSMLKEWIRLYTRGPQ